MRSRTYVASQNGAKSAAKMKLTVFVTAMTLLALATQSFVFASDGASIAGSSGTNTARAPEAGEEIAKGSGDLAVENTNIEDLAYTLQRIRQQAINIYIESTRKKLKCYELNIVSLSTMPTTPLESQSAYLPLRKAWLAFFIGTMEPLVQILNENIKHLDEKTEQCQMPSHCHNEWHAIVSDWKSAINQLNDQLNVCASLINDSSPENIEVAKTARSIDYQITQCDRILRRASKFLHDNVPTS
jgi:hypothetical protein